MFRWSRAFRIRSALRSLAPLPDACDFIRWYVQEFQKLLMLGGGGALEFHVPALLLLFTESRSLHDRNPFVFCDHFPSPDCVLILEKT